jgi:hypothetical protein
LARSKLVLPETNAHFAKTASMDGAGANGTNFTGELKGLEGLHVVDGAVSPSCRPSMQRSRSWPMQTVLATRWAGAGPFEAPFWA